LIALPCGVKPSIALASPLTTGLGAFPPIGRFDDLVSGARSIAAGAVTRHRDDRLRQQQLPDHCAERRFGDA